MELMSFPDALKLCLAGAKISNTNWRGLGAYLFSMPGYVSIAANETLSKGSGIEIGTKVCIAPYLMRFNSAGVYVPYNVTNIDIYSDNWYVVQ